MKESIYELAETETTDIRGTSIGTVYGSQPVKFLKEIIDAGKKNFYFANFVKEITLEKGFHQASIPKRSAYLGSSGFTANVAGTDTGASSGAGTGPYANTIADISWTAINTNANVVAKPLPVIFGSTVRKYDLDTNAVITMDFVKDELSYAMGDRIDAAIATTIGDATMSQSAAIGAQVIFGGDATSTATLSAGDVITTDMVATGARKLIDTACPYRDGSTGLTGTETANSVTKPAWHNTPDDPYVLFIGPAQEEAFRKDSQFVNASEYGDNTIIQNGEIGMIRYLGVRLVVTNNVERTAASGTGPDGGTAAVATTRCIMMKGKKACALVWGKKPELRVWEYNERDEVRFALYTYYDIKVIHDSAIVFLQVADD